MPSEKEPSFKCADCRVVISNPVQYNAWETMRAHTLEAHGREPYCNPAGQYKDDDTLSTAVMGAHPELFLVMAS